LSLAWKESPLTITSNSPSSSAYWSTTDFLGAIGIWAGELTFLAALTFGLETSTASTAFSASYWFSTSLTIFLTFLTGAPSVLICLTGFFYTTGASASWLTSGLATFLLAFLFSTCCFLVDLTTGTGTSSYESRSESWIEIMVTTSTLGWIFLALFMTVERINIDFSI